jgi:hypothetical protein
MGIAYEVDGRVYNVQPGALVAAHNQVEVTLENLRRLAGETLDRLRVDARHARSSFAAVPVGGGIFGETPQGQQLAGVHRAAVDVFLATIEGIEAELVQMQTNLRDTISSYEGSDADAGEVLTRYLARLERAGFEPTSMIDQRVQQVAEAHREVLSGYADGGPASHADVPAAGGGGEGGSAPDEAGAGSQGGAPKAFESP